VSCGLSWELLGRQDVGRNDLHSDAYEKLQSYKVLKRLGLKGDRQAGRRGSRLPIEDRDRSRIRYPIYLYA